MHSEQRRRTTALLKARNLPKALFSDPQSVAWLTGFAPALQVVPSPFLGQAAFVWYEGGHYTLLLQDSQAGKVSAGSDLSVLPYASYTLDAPIRIPDHQRRALEGLVTPSSGPVGVEQKTLPYHLYSVLEPYGDTKAIDGLLEPLRMVKTSEELAKLKEVFALTDVGFGVAEEQTQVGQREIDVWTSIQSAVEREAGQRVALGNDCVVGDRAGNVGGWPEVYALTETSGLIVDLSVSKDAYWSDGCRSYFAREPSQKQRRVYQTVKDALHYGASLLKPGLKANALDEKLRAFVAASGYPVYPHHSGHSVGVHTHENPRITPDDATALEAGMVILLEPGIYYPGEFGVRLEDGFLITADGAERLTRAPTSY